MTFEKVAKILADYRDIEVDNLTNETPFEELELDSLDMVELIMSIEEAFGVTIEMSDNIKTIGDVVAIIEKA